MKIGLLEAELQKSVFSLCLLFVSSFHIKTTVFVSQLLVDRFSKFEGLNALEFRSESREINRITKICRFLPKIYKQWQNDQFLKKIALGSADGGFNGRFPVIS